MKNIGLTTLLLSLCLVLSACGANPVLKKTINKKDNFSPQVDLTLAEWVESGLTLECVVDAPENEITLRVKDSRIRIDGIAYSFSEGLDEPPYRGKYLFDGDTLYIWKGKKGVEMDTYIYNELNHQVMGGEYENDNTWHNVIDIWETAGFPYKCREVNLAEDYFLPDPEVEYLLITEEVIETSMEESDSE